MFKNIWKGGLIGIANVIPGVSGGTLALILGIYEKLTEAIGEFFNCSKSKRIEYIKFLVQIMIGAVSGIILFSKVISYMFEQHYEETSFFFLGLIVASLPMIMAQKKGNSKVDKKQGILFFIGGLVPLAFMLFDSIQGDVSGESIERAITIGYMGKLVMCGALAGGAMIIPGISGSLLLLLLGEYSNIIGFISDFNIVPIGAVVVGAGSGIIIFAKLMGKLLKDYHDETLYFVLGLVVFSLLEIWPGVSGGVSGFGIDIIAFIIGAFIVTRLKSK